MTDLHAIASSLPNVDVGVACAGTALESRTYLVGKKSFLFVSKKEARLKLAASADEARALRCAVGANGWVKLELTALPPAAVVERWVAESHALMSASGAARTSVTARTPAKKSGSAAAKRGSSAKFAVEVRSKPKPRGSKKSSSKKK